MNKREKGRDHFFVVAARGKSVEIANSGSAVSNKRSLVRLLQGHSAGLGDIELTLRRK
jgi:hypothetical protein